MSAAEFRMKPKLAAEWIDMTRLSDSYEWQVNIAVPETAAVSNRYRHRFPTYSAYSEWFNGLPEGHE